jgi:tetratricopeptide (TPR) repeat protein
LNGEFEIGLSALKERNFEKAKDSFLGIIERKPESAESHYGLSISFYELGNIGDAEKHLKAAFSLFEAQHKLSEAYAAIFELVQIKPEVIRYSFDFMRIYLKLKFMKSFVQLLLKSVSDMELSDDVLNENLAALAPFIKDEKVKSTIIVKKQAGKKEDEKLNPFENLELANLLFEIGSTDEAKIEYYKTARAFLNRDLKEKAQELYVKIKEIYPEDSDLENLKKEVDSYGEEKQQIDISERLAQLEDMIPSLENENESRMRYSFAVVFKEFARYENAREELVTIFNLEKSPEKIKAFVLLSQIFIDLKENEKAIEVLESAIESEEFSESESVPLQYKIGTIYERMGKLQDALAIFESAETKDPEYLDVIEKVKRVKEKIEKKGTEEEEVAPEEIVEGLEVKTEELFTEVEEKPKEEKKKVKKVVKKEFTLKERILYI